MQIEKGSLSLQPRPKPKPSQTQTPSTLNLNMNMNMNMNTPKKHPDSVAGSFMHVQMCLYGLSCCPFGHGIDTACYYYKDIRIFKRARLSTSHLGTFTFTNNLNLGLRRLQAAG
jgi:hypothetical protein